jgi:hypothetical protein
LVLISKIDGQAEARVEPILRILVDREQQQTDRIAPSLTPELAP